MSQTTPILPTVPPSEQSADRTVHARGVGENERREAAIQAAYLDLISATTPAQRRMHQEMMFALIRGRAPEVMELLERQRMERASK